LRVEASLNDEKNGLDIIFDSGKKVFGDRTAGAPFSVYAPGAYAHPQEPGRFESARTWSYGVKAGDKLSDTFPLHEFEGGKYHLRVYGPNGFFREFKGDAADPSYEMLFNYSLTKEDDTELSGDGFLYINNSSQQPYTVEIADLAYGRPPLTKTIPAGGSGTIVLSLQHSQGWYDFTVQIDGFDHFQKRYAGRVETGRPGISDPHMGRLS
jgi:phospholipase C